MTLKITEKPTDSLIPYARNARTHSPAQVSQIAASIKEFGFNNPVLIDKDGGIIAGHGRVLAAQKLELKTVPTITLRHLTETQRKAYILADNKLALNAGWDEEMLKLELDELKAADFDLSLLGFDNAELSEISAGSGAEGKTDPDEIPETPETPKSEVGKIYQCGKHRVLCGDSTKPEDVTRLMNGKVADMLLTDPPYGVSYVGKTADALEVENDKLGADALATLLASAFDNAVAVCRPGSYWYATVPAVPIISVFIDDWNQRKILRQCLVWIKDSMVLGHSEYHYRHEIIMFGWMPGERHKNKDRTRTSVWECPKPSASREHPTMKPVALWEIAVGDGSISGETIYDPFLGSGTSVIAAEKSGRICYGMEISPSYVDVIRKRWAEFVHGKDCDWEALTPEAK